MPLEVPLSIRRCTSPATPTAWLIPGANASEWLEEICGWNVNQQELRIWPFPTNQTSLRPCGLIVRVAPGVNPNGVNVAAQCLGLQVIADRLLLPVDAELFPKISAAEAAVLFPAGYQYAWLPATGLVKIADDDLLGVADLLCWDPPVTPRSWQFAHPGITVVRRLASIQAPIPDDLEQWLASGGEQIGEDSQSLSDLPPVSGEPPRDMVSRAIRGAAAGAAAGLSSVARYLESLDQTSDSSGSPSSGSGWIQQLADWSSKQSGLLREKIEAARNYQLNRLMSMLEQDPDQGLRYAISMADMPHRGSDHSSTSLHASDVNFNWSTLFGGGRPAGYWDVGRSYREQLSQKYRELGQRETNLGRHRRAAYIYAHLLGDLVAAAGALRAGRHYREAAALYQHKLNRKRMAAACLAEGGYYEEAIELYVDAGGFLEAGDLALQNEGFEQAKKWYEEAVNVARQKNNMLRAANIQFTKLGDLDGAVQLLRLGWPMSADAEKCLRSELDWLCKARELQRAIERIRQIQTQSLNRRATILATNVLSKLSIDTAQSDVAHAAREACTAMVSRKLCESPSVDDRQILLSLSNIHPDDRMLRRDCHRFIDDRASRERTSRPTRRPRRSVCSMIRKFQLSPKAAWLQAIRVGDGIVAVGDDGAGMAVTKADFHGYRIACSYLIRAVPSEPTVLLSMLPGTDEVLCRPLANQIPVKDATISQVGQVGALRLSDGWHVADDVLCCDLDMDQLWTARITMESGDVLVQSVRESGVHHSWSFNWPTSDLPLPMFMHARSGAVFLAAEQAVVMLRQNELRHAVLPCSPTGLCGSLPNSLARVVVTSDHGAYLLWRGDDFDSALLADGIDQPVAEFTADGHLVIAGNRQLEVYAVSNSDVVLRHQESNRIGESPVAVLRGERPNEFLLLDADGTVQCFRITR